VQNPYFLALYPQFRLACYRKLIDKFMAHDNLSQGSVRLLANIKDTTGLDTSGRTIVDQGPVGKKIY